MVGADDPRRGDRVKAAAGALALQALLGYALIVGLGMRMPAAAIGAIKLFDVAPPPPPPERPAARKIRARREGAAAPPNLKASATPIVAPPVVAPRAPPPVVAAPVARSGAAPFAGAADVPGPGSGGGGRGDGTGSGGAGDGDGGGGGGGGGTPPRLLRGRIRNSDYPDPYVHGSLETRYVVGADGRVARCIVTRSSGSALLDETTCRLVMKRYRYKPATDAAGRPVEVIVIQNHSWEIEEAPPPP